MKKFLRILGFLLLFLVVAAAAGLLYFNSAYPVKIPVEDLKLVSNEARLERGKYLAHNVSNCIDCHSARDFKFYSGPIVDGTWGQGGEKFDKALAEIPGTLYAKNITPAGIGSWTDGEFMRAIVSGINKDNEALFPLMPYTHYAGMAKEDILSIMAYIRSLPPINNDVPERTLEFPLNFIVKTIPAPATMSENIPDKANTLAYGKYMVNASACIECHTMAKEGVFLPGMEFAGGRKFTFPNGDVNYTANITPDNETGIGLLTKEAFIAKFKTFVDSTGQPVMIPVVEHQKNTVMPWTKLGGMTEEDLGAIYEYLRSIPPVKHSVTTFIAGGKGI
ncbi:MAG: cytochrome C [Bacteroidia bacterium]|nr:cytochrome C [Bacteroidia bacterium]